jgi:hypothetical protein
MSLGEQTLTGVFPRSRSEKITSGPVDLVQCSSPKGCGLVQLKQSYDLSEMYGLNYGYRSGLNASMVKHLHSKVDKILSSGLLERGDLVIDIGSNDATTLRAYPSGLYQLVGIDPTGVKFSSYYPPEIRLIPEFFTAMAVSQTLSGKKAKIITSFSMFYDLEDPVAFAKEINGALDDEGLWIFEQSYLPAMLKTNSFDTICHEHLEFYALKQINWITEKAGLKVIDVEFNDINGGSFSVTATPAIEPYFSAILSAMNFLPSSVPSIPIRCIIATSRLRSIATWSFASAVINLTVKASDKSFGNTWRAVSLKTLAVLMD